MSLAQRILPTRSARRTLRAIADHGAATTIRDAIAKLGIPRQLRHFDRPTSTVVVHPFDERYKVDTSGLIDSPLLRTHSRSDRWSTAYYAIPPSIFSIAMSYLPPDLQTFSFIDLGSGKGRAVMLASLLGFAAVYGVELSPALHTIAVSNMKSFAASVTFSSRIILYKQDAAAFAFPEGPLVLFLYHPFGKPVLKRVLANLRQSLEEHPRHAYIVYINAELRDLLEKESFLRPVAKDLVLPLSAEDYLPDRTGSSMEECAIFESTILPS